MKILVTGCCGFVGRALLETFADALSGSGATYELFGIDNLTRPGSELNRRAMERRGVRFVHGDLRVPSDLAALPEVDWVVDAAANPSVLAGVDGRSSSRQTVEHNLFGTCHLLEYCRRSQAGLLLLSSSRVYSISDLSRLPVVATPEEDALQLDGSRLPDGVTARGLTESFSTAAPVSLYGGTKLASEVLALEYHHAFGLPVWINRCGILAGPGQFGRPDQGIIAFWIHSWLARRPLKYIGFGGHGHQVRDCLHPRDLGTLLLKQMSDSDGGGPRLHNVSGGIESAFSLKQLSNWCRDRLGPHDVGADPQDRPFDIPWLVLDSSAARARWDWSPATSRDALFEQVAEFAQQHPDWLERTGAF